MAVYSERLRQTEKQNSLKLVRRVAISMLLILLTAVAVNIFVRQDQELERLQREMSGLDRQIQQLEAEAYDLEEQRAQAGSEEFLERVARDRLGLVKADELIFID